MFKSSVHSDISGYRIWPFMVLCE